MTLPERCAAVRENDQPREDPVPWLHELEEQVRALLDPANQGQRERKVEELLALSNRFLELSRKFLEMGKNASQAAQDMLSPEAPEVEPP
jgi:hypothetical protein